MWTEAERRIGIVSAGAVGMLGLLYVGVGLLGVALRPPGMALLAQVDPWLAVMEGLIILTAIALVIMAAAVQAYASPAHRLHARLAFAFIAGFAMITCATHFANLTVGRQLAGRSPGLVEQLSFGWPTVNLALDLLAWDLLLGLALLFLAAVFDRDGGGQWVRGTACVAGLLCLAGLAGPLSGRMEFQFAAIAGYAFVMPALCVMIAFRFARTPAGVHPSG